MSIANTVVRNIRESIGDLQNTRWSDAFICAELDKSAERLLGLFKKHGIDYGQGRQNITLGPGEDAFVLPADFRGAVGLYYGGRLVELLTAEEWEVTNAYMPFAVWAVDGKNGLVKASSPQAASLMLRYWKLPAPIEDLASFMPWEGTFDAIMADYVRLRLANYDEMTVAQDTQLLADMENSLLTLALARNPSLKKSKGWL